MSLGDDIGPLSEVNVVVDVGSFGVHVWVGLSQYACRLKARLGKFSARHACSELCSIGVDLVNPLDLVETSVSIVGPGVMLGVPHRPSHFPGSEFIMNPSS